MRKLAIYGAGGLGRLVLDIVRRGQQFEPVGFLDSDPARIGDVVEGVPVLGGFEVSARLHEQGVTDAVVAIGDNHTRTVIATFMRDTGFRWASIIDPTAVIAANALISPHCIVGPKAIVCVHARVGPLSVISSGAIVEHDCVLDEGVFLHPAVRLAGGVQVGARAILDVGASVIPGRCISADSYVGAGAVVIRDVAEGARVAGVPARAVPTTPQGLPRAERLNQFLP